MAASGSHRLPRATWAPLILLLAALCACTEQPEPGKHIKDIPWALTGPSVIVDLHTHSRFSDGALTVDELVHRALGHGCGGLAVTDHSDHSEQAASPAYFDAIAAARARYPDLILLAGLEWNVSEHGAREHLAVLVAPDQERELLSGFKVKFDTDATTEQQALQWLHDHIAPNTEVALIYNHPTRARSSSLESADALLRWQSIVDLPVHFEGGPGHQKADPAEVYGSALPPLDRWDAMAAEVGGGWDRLLDAGHDVWGAIASSDYHGPRRDYEPCEFSRTHVQVPDRSPRGVLEALRAGSFWSDHGRLLEDFAMAASTQELSIPLTPGESARVPANRTLQLGIALQRGPGAAGERLQVELIGNCEAGQPGVLRTKTLGPSENKVSWTFRDLKPGADQRSCYVRARIRKPVAGAADLLAYSNPIRLILR